MAEVNWILLLYKIFKILVIVNWFLTPFLIFWLLITYCNGSYKKYLKDPKKLEKIQKGYAKLRISKLETLISSGIIAICCLILWYFAHLKVFGTGDLPPQVFLLISLGIIPIPIDVFALEIFLKNILDKTKIG
ncbi:MAG: hypothetical protein JW914_10605 [Syntrophaceae bacterium]|nr:hypothetical protein [Syntrophaceae bacterium]